MATTGTTETTEMYNCIEAERARKGWTIEQFAEKIGICEKTYRIWRDNSRTLTSDTLISIARTFDCSVDYILGLSDKISRGA